MGLPFGLMVLENHFWNDGDLLQQVAGQKFQIMPKYFINK
jgi:hypothetical protein